MNQDTAETVQPRVAPPLPTLVASAGGPVAIIPRSIDEVWRIATLVVKAKLAPSSFETAEKVCVAIMHGAEIGLTPMQALQRIAVINGRPSIWGEAVPGLALKTGLVEDWIERIDGEGDLMVATCTVKRKGIRSPTTRTFSVADAKVAKLWGKQGPWQQYPKRMLQMRARVAFRDLFADALGGLYIAEEMIGVDEPKDITPPADPVTPPPAGGQKELPPLVPQSVKETQTFVSTKVIEGEIINPDAKSMKNGKGNKKPLPPLAAKAEPEPAPAHKGEMSDEEAERMVTVMLDQLDFAETKMSLAAWAQNNVPTLHRMPKEKRAKVETAFNLKDAMLQKQQS